MRQPVSSRLIKEQVRVFAKNLVCKRAELDISRAELARRSGVSESAIEKYESRKVQPCALNIVLLARALDCTTDHLLGVERREHGSDQRHG